MKKASSILALLVAMFFSLNVQGKQAPDYYAGKWDVLVKGTPNGDVHFLFTITEKDGKLEGTFVDPETKKICL